uniref:Uncharacterized protein LOC104228290 n=1 Tax=Nicotiana sylvestris TaxID=4096 RepID=A0A1U7WP10_NICSY|nr:PREDICTED: uncharacterized protein LOC104228290 [Nicotiana sylvestris]
MFHRLLHPLRKYIVISRYLLRQLHDPKIQKIYREQNGVADCLARHGATHVEANPVLFSRPPNFVLPSYQQDQAGTLCRRLCKSTAMLTNSNCSSMCDSSNNVSNFSSSSMCNVVDPNLMQYMHPKNSYVTF